MDLIVVFKLAISVTIISPAIHFTSLLFRCSSSRKLLNLKDARKYTNIKILAILYEIKSYHTFSLQIVAEIS